MPTPRTILTRTVVLTACAIAGLSATSVVAWTPLNGTHRQLDPDKFFVTPFIGKPIDTTCYRLTAHQTDNAAKKCPDGYKDSPDKVTQRCWAECPMEYPVQCGFECLPRDTTCIKEVGDKAKAIADVALNYLSGGVYGFVVDWYRTAEHWVQCALAVEQVTVKIGELFGDKKDEAMKDKNKRASVLKVAKNLEIVNTALDKCLGVNLKALAEAKAIEKAQALQDAFLAKLGNVQLGNDEDKKAKAAEELFTETGSPQPEGMTKDEKTTCVDGLKDVVHKIFDEIVKLKKMPGTTPEKIHAGVAILNPVVRELPGAVLTCFGKKLWKYYQPAVDVARAFVDKMVDDVVGEKLTKTQLTIMVIDRLFGAMTIVDRTGLAKLAQEFIAPVCGPTVFTTAVSFGTAAEACGLSSTDWAFKGSSGTWAAKTPATTPKGTVSIHFKNEDSHKETVYIISGGKKIHEFQIEKGDEADWTSATVEAEKKISLAGKTLLIKREVVRRLARDTLEGGSVLVWVPENEGHLNLNVIINPRPEDSGPPPAPAPAGNGKVQAANNAE